MTPLVVGSFRLLPRRFVVSPTTTTVVVGAVGVVVMGGDGAPCAFFTCGAGEEDGMRVRVRVRV